MTHATGTKSRASQDADHVLDEVSAAADQHVSVPTDHDGSPWPYASSGHCEVCRARKEHWFRTMYGIQPS